MPDTRPQRLPRQTGARVLAPQPASPAARDRQRLAAVLLLSSVVLIVELVGAAVANSLALLADAGHVLSDVGGVALALAAVTLAQRPASGRRTFGYLRLEVLAAVANAGLLLIIGAFILVEAWRRLSAPPEIAPGAMLAFAVVGLAANAASLLLLRDAQQQSLTVRGAYLEVAGDLAGSAAVIVAAVVIALTGWTWADVVASAAVGLLILPRTAALLRDATNILLEAAPKGVDLDLVRAHVLDAPGVVDCHDLHAWTITSGVNVVSAHVVIAPDAQAPAVLEALSRCLSDDFDIEHSTFQLESVDRRRLEERGHV